MLVLPALMLFHAQSVLGATMCTTRWFPDVPCDTPSLGASLNTSELENAVQAPSTALVSGVALERP